MRECVIGLFFTVMLLLNVAVLLLLQILGESISIIFQLPIPGPVIGMVLLLFALIIKPEMAEKIRPVAALLLAHLALLFVPAGVGVLQQIERLSEEWLAIVVILIFGTGMTMIATAITIQWVAKKMNIEDSDDD